MSNVIRLDDYRPKRKPPSRMTKADLKRELDQIDELCNQLQRQRDAHLQDIAELEERIEELELTSKRVHELEKRLEEAEDELENELENSRSADEVESLENDLADADEYAEGLEELISELTRIAVTADPDQTRHLLLTASRSRKLPQDRHEFPWRLLPPFV